MKIEGSARDSVELVQPSFGEAPERFNTVDMTFSVGELVLAMSNAKVFLIAKVDQAVVADPAVTMNYGVQCNSSTNNSLEGFLFRVWDDLSIDTISSFVDAEDDRFPTSSAPLSSANAARPEVGLVNFDNASNRRVGFTVLSQSFSNTQKYGIDATSAQARYGCRFSGVEIQCKTPDKTAKFVLRNL